MSAFIVEDKTINTIVTFLAMNRDGDWHRRQFKDKGYDLNTDEGKSKLGSAMFRLNIAAVTQRYDGGAEDFRPLNYRYQLQPYYTPEAVLKALQCWLYQCSEGNVPQADLYLTFSQIKGEIACDIVRNSKQYQEANWG